MHQAVKVLCSIFAISFVAAAIVVLLQQLTGERPTEYLYPCFLLGGGLLNGWLAWHFGSPAGAGEICSSDDDDSRNTSATAMTDSD